MIPAMTEIRVIKRVRGLSYQFGGEEHVGWLPEGAAMPLPTPIVHAVLDLEIEFDGSGYLLNWMSQDGSVGSDLWFESLADAEAVAAVDFGVQSSQWEIVSPSSGESSRRDV